MLTVFHLQLTRLGGRAGALLTWHIPQHPGDANLTPCPAAPAPCNGGGTPAVGTAGSPEACAGCASASRVQSPVLSVMASGLKPCSGLRLWVRRRQPQGGDPLSRTLQPRAVQPDAATEQAGEQSRGGSAAKVWTSEVTHLAAWLPAVVAPGRRAVRDWG